MSIAERRSGDRDGYPPPALTSVVLAIITAVLAAWAVAVIAETSARAFATYTPVEATVVDERIEQRLIVDRRGSTRAPFRIVIVELPNGVRADVRSEDLSVGAAATVYRSGTGDVFEDVPAPPGLLEWALCVAITAAGLVLATVTVRGILRLRAARSE